MFNFSNIVSAALTQKLRATITQPEDSCCARCSTEPGGTV